MFLFLCFKSKSQRFVQSKCAYIGKFWWCSFAFRIKQNCKEDIEHGNNNLKIKSWSISKLTNYKCAQTFWRNIWFFSNLSISAKVCHNFCVAAFSRESKKRFKFLKNKITHNFFNKKILGNTKKSSFSIFQRTL